MSQAKVDKYKEEKKNRAKTMKRNKIKKVIAIFVCALGIGAIVGIPLGKYVYKEQKEAEARNATIAKADFESWFDKKWAGSYSSLFANSADALQDMLNGASESDADEVDDEELEAGDGEEIELDGDDIELDEDDPEVEE